MRKTLLIVIVLMAGIATAEVALTLGRYGDSAPGLLPDGTPTRGHSYETRNPYVNRTFSDATINIVVFGGAWVFGLGCDTDETFSAILEKSFAANDPPVRVVNLGQPDFTSAEVAKTFPRMLARYKADAAVVMTGLTDAVPLLLKDDYFARRPFTIAERGSLDVVRLVRLYGTLRFAAMVHGGGFKRASETTFKARYFPMEKTQDNLLEIGKRAARLRVPVVYVTFPRNEASSWLHPHYPIYNERNLLIRTTAYNYNAKLLDLEALMHPLKTPEYLLPWMRWPHPNAAGHAYIADNLRTELIAAVPGLNL
ncbi:MAG: GDSL-type esterase/lipase family protein [Deltaproteobacteria bacterium]|nr:GDSL-type esterase/lipase family protein [Deltaproteobacteria bacterium]